LNNKIKHLKHWWIFCVVVAGVCGMWNNTVDFGLLFYVLWKFAGSNPAEAVGFLRGEKNPQHAFLRRGSKAVSPMS